MTDVSEIISLLQDLELDEKELTELVTSITEEGLTESVKRRLRSTLMNAANRDVKIIEQYEQALDIINKYDAEAEKIVHEGEQTLNQLDLKTKSKLETFDRKINEDATASKVGATLLLHSDDVAPSEDSTRRTPSATEDVTTKDSITPKQAVTVAVEAAKKIEPKPTPSLITPSFQPDPQVLPNLPPRLSNSPNTVGQTSSQDPVEMSSSGGVPATQAPLPPTPVAPPAVTSPSRSVDQ